MTDKMTAAVRDDLAKLAYALVHGMPKSEAKEALSGMFATQHDISEDMAWALYVRGKSLASQQKPKTEIPT